MFNRNKYQYHVDGFFCCLRYPVPEVFQESRTGIVNHVGLEGTMQKEMGTSMLFGGVNPKPKTPKP